MARIIPGVEVTVIKEVVPPQLAPSGVLGLIGLVAPKPARIKDRKRVERVGNWGRFRELYGSATALAMPEAQQAVQNGVYELVVVAVESSVAAAASADIEYAETPWLKFEARCPGTAANGLKLVFTPQVFQSKVQGYELRVRDIDDEDLEVHRNLSPFPGSARWMGSVLDAADSIVTVKSLVWDTTDYSGQNADSLVNQGDKTTFASLGSGQTKVDALVIEKTSANTPGIRLSTDNEGVLTITRDPGGPNEAVILSVDAQSDTVIEQVMRALEHEDGIKLVVTLPSVTAKPDLADGVDASVDEYRNALDQLIEVPDVDLVIAAVQQLDIGRAAQIYGAVIAHCETMSADAKGRLGFGQVPAASSVENGVDLVGSLVSDRFALFVPHGVLGAAVGRIGSLPYFHSPTFKSLAGLGEIPSLRLEDQRSYLKANIVPVAELPGRGNVVVRGLTTDGDQISVRRVADRAVRGVKQIGELFIGKLNTENGRNALKQKLSEFLLQMASENAIVPSTDGSDPAFKLNVYSTQADFALGIVRVDLAIRPVRAIDFIYATVLVQV